MTMTPEQARATRLPDLETAVATSARCHSKYAPGPTNPHTGDWFREDGETTRSWTVRRVALLDYCTTCPVLNACREIGLRRDAPDADGDMVRGGMTGDKLSAMRRSRTHRKSIKAAIDADDAHDPDAERREINRLAAELRTNALELPDPRTRRGTRRITGHQPGGPDSPESTAATRAALQSLRTTRRARAGWNTAA